jgi:hypothetical protein
MEKVQNLKNSNTAPSSKTFRDEGYQLTQIIFWIIMSSFDALQWFTLKVWADDDTLLAKHDAN